MVGRVLGEGGFGITYLGLDLTLQRKVAIKEYFPTVYVKREASLTLDVTCYTKAQETPYVQGREQFLQEARTLAKLDRVPAIVRVLDFFSANNTAYIVMEYLEGDTLGTMSSQLGPIPLTNILGYLEPVLRAMDTMHAAGIIHRDISPDNIMRLRDGQVKLLDFGCARNTQGGNTLTVVLKHGYAPIEQYTGHNQGPWTDIYALCATIYRCLTGKTPPDALRRGGTGPDPLVSPRELGAKISAAQESALLKGLAVFSEDRYQNAAELYKALYGATIDGSPSECKTEPLPVEKTLPMEAVAPPQDAAKAENGTAEAEPSGQKAPPARRRPKMLYIGIAVAAACCLALGIALRPSGPSKVPDVPEQQNEEEQQEKKPEESAPAPEVHGVTWSFDDGVLTFSGTGKMPECENQTWTHSFKDGSYGRSDARPPWFENLEDIKHVVIEDGVTNISTHAFAFCNELVDVTIPDSVTEIGESAFSYCHNLESIKIPNGVKTIHNGTFEFCDMLGTVYLPDSISTISEYAFLDCRSLTNLTIPNGVTEIGNSAFLDCESLGEVSVPVNCEYERTSFPDTCRILKKSPEGKPLEKVVFNDMFFAEQSSELTPDQKEFVRGLHAEELPREAVDLSSEFKLDQIWEDMLIPLASDPTNDLTLYGLVDSDWVAVTRKTTKTVIPTETNTYEMPEPLMILRHGNDLIGCGLNWYENVEYLTNPWIGIGDFDGDGEVNEVAACTFAAIDMDIYYHQLGIYNLDTLKRFIVDISSLEVWADFDWERDQVTLYAGTYTLTSTIPDYISEGSTKSISYGLVVKYDYNKHASPEKELTCTMGIAFDDDNLGAYPYFAEVTASIIKDPYSLEAKYELGPVLSIAAVEY